MKPPIAISVGDTVRLKKKHPCGSEHWEVTRIGADIGIKCRTCGRRVMVPRSQLERQLREISPGYPRAPG